MSANTLIAQVQTIDAQWNTHDLEAALATFTDDAVVTLVPPPPGQRPVSRGKAEIREFLAANMAGFHVDSRDYEVTGPDSLRWIGVISNDLFRQLGLDGLETVTEATFQGDKLRAFTVTFTPQALAQIGAAMTKAGLVGTAG